MKLLIASKNPGKIEGAKKAFEKYFENVEIEGISVDSNVSEQPINEEICQGAKNRIQNLKQYASKNQIDADYFLSIESGIQNLLGSWMITNIAIIENKEGTISCGTSPSFPVPEKYVQEVIDTTLSIVMDKVLGKDEERHNKKGGIQLLTHNEISRIKLTELAFVMALTQYINGETWR